MLDFIKKLFASPNPVIEVSKSEIVLDQTIKIESNEKPKYLVYSGNYLNQFSADKTKDEFTLGYVLLDNDLKCIEYGFELIDDKQIFTSKTIELLKKVEYIVGFRIDNVTGLFIDLEIDNYDTIPISLMECGAKFVGIPHQTKKQYKWPKLIELTSKLFLQNNNQTLVYKKYAEGEVKLDTKIFIRMMELKLIDFSDLNNTQM
jgi:hypothetical protein